jgi:RNA polymerase sigma-70 factor (ECF subfamily)
MPTPVVDSARILARIAAGAAGETEWQVLVERHGPAMRQAAKLAAGNDHLMDDAVQEALLQLPRCAARFQPHPGEVELQVGRWLQRLAVNCALALRRAEKRRHRRESLHAEMVMHDAVVPGDDPRSEQMAQALEGLNESERQVLLLRHVEGLDHHGLAAALGTNPAVARKRLSRAHERLRGRLVHLACNTSLPLLVAKLDAVSRLPLPPQPTVVWVKAAASGSAPALTSTAAIIPGGAAAMSVSTLIGVPILAVSLAVGSAVITARSSTPDLAPPVVASPPHAKGRTVTIGNGSGMLDYPTAQATLKLEPGDVLSIAPGTYLGLSLGNLAGTAEAPITVTCDARTLFTSPGGRSDTFTNLSFVRFENFRIDKGSPWVFAGATHDLRFSHFTATRSFCFRPYDPAKVFNGSKDSAFYNFIWEDCSFGDDSGPFAGSAISSTDWQPVSNLKSVQLDFEIARCTFKNVDFGTEAGTVVSMSRCFNLKVHDCTFSNLGYSKFIVGHDTAISGSGYFKIYGNTFSRHWANDVRMYPMKLNALGHDGKDAVTSFHDNISFEKRKYPVFEQNGVPREDLARSSGWFSATGSEVCFNTVYRSRRGTMTADPYRGVLVDVYAPDVTIRNNLIIEPECDAPFDPARNYVYLLGAGPQPGIVAEGNLVFRTWEEAGLVDRIGFVPSATSPAKDAAKGPIDSTAKDHAGRERHVGAAADVGAVERQKGDR